MRIRGSFRGSVRAVLAALVSTSFASAAMAITVTRTVDPPGLVSIDGCGTYCNTLPSLSFDATDFPPSAVVADVDASITWFKTDGSCATPGLGAPFHVETNFRLDGPAATNVILAPPGTWDTSIVTAAVTTVFDQAAAAVPSGTPVSGSFLPTPGNLNAFNGLSALSTWALRAGDTGTGDPLCVDRYSVTVTATSRVLINEVDADTAGTDTLEFVELYDGGVGNTPLDGLVLVFYNGAGDTAYAAFDLDGEVTDANGYFVLGNAAVANVSLVFSDNLLQNGADAVALYLGDATGFPNGTAVTVTNLVDALVYDTSDGDDAGLLALLLPGQPQINEDGNGNKDFESNQRCPDGAGGARVSSGYIQDSPTPGSENCPVPTADLSITKTDGVATAVPGASVTYTITGSNAGPDAVVGASVVDNFPATLSCSWICVGAGGGSCTAVGTGNINDAVDLPAGASVTYTANCAIDSAATGSLSNTASISSATLDPNMANNSATDTDTLTPQVDVGVTNTDGVTTAVPGQSVTYTIVASNSGPSDAPSAPLVNSFVPSLSCSYSSVAAGGASGNTAAGAGNITDILSLPAGATVTYTAVCSISPAATGSLLNQTGIASANDINPANNSATDIDTLTPQADLVVTKDDGVTSATPGGSVTWAIGVSNPGPSDAPGSSVTDTFPAACTAVNWTCTGSGGGSCAAGGSGNIADTVNLPAGGSVSYSATCAIDIMATGTLVNTASATVGAGVTELDPANNSATDSDTLTPDHDLSITKTDGVTSAIPGQSVTWTIVASNAGPSNAVGAMVSDNFPASCTSVSWTCVGAGGGTCAANGSGNIADTVNLPVGGTATYSATCNISAAATGTLDNTATIAGAAGSTDPVAANNSATDSDTLVPTADVAITKTDGVTSAIPGQAVTWTIVASNGGPSDAVGATVTDNFPAVCTSVTWTCVGAGGGTCAGNGSGNIADTVNLPVGGTATYSATCPIDPAATGTLDNTATIAVAAGTTDPNAANNSASDSDTLDPSADLSITKVEQGVPVPTLLGSSFSYLLTASNAGPSTATGVVVSDSLPATLSYVSNSCGATFAAPTLSWNIGTLASGSNASCTINVTVAALGTITNTASLSSATTDPTPANNAATSTLAGAQEVDVTISLAASAGAGLAVGDSYTYTVTGSNLGVGLAAGLDFTLSLSGKVSFVSSNCAAVLNGNTLSWSVATLADGASTSCDIGVVVVLPGDIQASANVVTATADPNLANNSAELTVAVAAIAIPTLDRHGLLLLMLLSAGLGMLMIGRVRSA